MPIGISINIIISFIIAVSMKLPKFELSMNYFAIQYFISSMCGLVFRDMLVDFEINEHKKNRIVNGR
jgi:hypothetical protein